MFEQNINIVLNSKEEIFIFRLSSEGEIIYNNYDSSLNFLSSNSLYDKNILKYATIIDEDNIIHLVALINTGELNYYKYVDENWGKATIAKFDLKSNLYNQFEILMIKNKLHIIYNYSNLINSNIWTIQHVVYDKENGEKHNAIRYISKRIPDSFIVDVDSHGTIHLLYRTYIGSSSHIYHIFYSPYTKAWSSLSKQISSDNMNSIFPFLFIDTQDNLHGLWIEEINNRPIIKYLRMSGSGKERYIWKEIQLPHIPISIYPPIIFEENNILKLLYLFNDNTGIFISRDYGSSWSKEDNNSPIKNTKTIKVKSNIETIKINYSYCDLSNSPRFSFLNLYSNKEPLETIKKPPAEIEDLPIDKPIEEQDDEKSNILNEINHKLDEILDNHDSLRAIIAKILSNQLVIEDKLDIIHKSMDLNNRSFFEKIFNSSK